MKVTAHYSKQSQLQEDTHNEEQQIDDAKGKLVGDGLKLL